LVQGVFGIAFVLLVRSERIHIRVGSVSAGAAGGLVGRRGGGGDCRKGFGGRLAHGEAR
jgi:hypothetical protein